MPFMEKLFIPPALIAGCLLCSVPVQAQQSAPADPQEIIHVLNRITFGPRPGDVEMVEKMSLANYIDQQLHPESIDDSAVDQQVQQLDIVEMSSPQLATLFWDDTKRFLKKQKEGQDTATENTATGDAMPGPAQTMTPAFNPNWAHPEMQPAAMASDTNEMAVQNAVAWRSVAAIGQLEDAKLIRAVESPRQLQEVLVDFWTNHFNIDMKKGPCRVLKVADDRDVIRPHILGRFRDLLEASAKSPAMLFYLDNAENSVSRELTPFQQQMASAYIKMTFGQFAQNIPAPGKKMGGINENYAREIMELHTLGVDGGYTQKDVQEVARCFTGWTLNRKTGEFEFTPRRHDNGEKFVLGHDIPAGGGIQDGETVLDILASAPATAHFISYELCQRFVSDTPPEPLVQRIAGVFQNTDGDLRQVTAAILSSPEFLSPSSYQTKIKSPLEFAVSAVRATESDLIARDPPPFDKLKPTVEGAAVLGRTKASDRLSALKRQSLNWHIYELGEPLFACTPPTGYKEVSKIWVSPGALIERLNFSLALTGQRLEDVRFDPKNILQNVDLDHPNTVLDQCVSALLQGNISPGTRQVLAQAALPAPGTSQTVDPSKLIALILGSPEFQRK
jgi:uncharacterized protein (DUF1800 family)